MEYRSATATDAGSIRALWAACGLSHGDESDQREIAERLTNDDGFFIVGNNAAGDIVSSAMGCYDNHRGWVKRVAVAPTLHGTGEGGRLIEELERRFKDAGVTELRLAVFQENERAGAFWAAQGYEELTNIRYFTKSLTDM